MFRCCLSVFTATSSQPLTPERISRFMVLFPPPPTPTVTILIWSEPKDSAGAGSCSPRTDLTKLSILSPCSPILVVGLNMLLENPEIHDEGKNQSPSFLMFPTRYRIRDTPRISQTEE